MSKLIGCCLSCYKDCSFEELSCIFQTNLCYTCRRPFVTQEHLIECPHCYLKKELFFNQCEICLNHFSSDEICNPSNCARHFYCLICLNNRNDIILNYFDFDYQIVFIKDSECPKCQLFFKAYIIEPRPPNCFMCGHFGIQIPQCRNHNYCQLCINSIVLREPSRIFDKVVNCKNCTSYFNGINKQRKIETYPGNSGLSFVQPSNKNEENPINQDYRNRKSSSKSNEKNPFSHSQEIIENPDQTILIEEYKDVIPRMSILELQEASKKMDPLMPEKKLIPKSLTSPRINCFCCTQNRVHVKNPLCGHEICEFCLFYYIYRPALVNMINTISERRLPKRKIDLKCKCKKEFTLTYPISKFLSYVESIVKDHTKMTLGKFYDDFTHINHYSSMFKNFSNYLEGFEVDFHYCPSCRYLCFKATSRLFCPWCQKFLN